MPALASPSTWRSHPQTTTGYLYLLNPTLVLSRRVNQVAFVYPVTEIAYDNPNGNGGSHTDCVIGQLVKVSSSSGAFKGWARLKAISSTLMTLAPVSQGDIDFADNDYIEVFNDFRLVSKIPFITNAGVQLKDYDLVFAANQAQPPVANAGAWYAGLIDPDSELITVSFDGTNSYAIADGASITGYSWDVQDGTITIGTSTSSQITATFPAGYRWVELTVTDSNSNTHMARTLVVAATPTTARRAVVSQLSGAIDGGWNAGFQLLEDDASNYPLGTPVVFWTDEKYGSTAGSLNGQSGRQHVKFCGWVSEDSTLIEPYSSDWSFTAQSAYGVLQNLPAFSQTTERSASPTSWFQVANLTWWRHVHYLMQWHTNLLELCDVERPSYFAGYDILRLDADAGSVVDQFKFAAEAVAAKFTVDHQGRVYFRRNPHLMSSSDRDNLTVTLTLQDTDWTERLDITQRNRPQVGVIFAAAIIANASQAQACKAAAPGITPGQGGQQESVDRWLVNSQADLNERLGRLYSFKNVPDPRVSVTVLNQGLVADPAWQEWIQFTMSVANKRDTSYAAQRFVLTSVSVRYDNANGTALENWELEKTGADAAVSAITIQIPGADPPEGDDPYIPTDGTYLDQLPMDYEYLPDPEYLPDTITVEPDPNPETSGVRAWAWSESGLYRSDNVDQSSPTWALIHDPAPELLRDMVESSGSDYPTGSTIKLWTLTDAALYYSADALAVSPSFTQKQSLTEYFLLRHAAGVGANAVVAFAKGAARTSGSGTASASSFYLPGSFGPASAFDNSFDFSVDNRWSSGNNTPPHWLEYDFGVDMDISAYSISGSPYPDGMASAYEMQYWNGSTWVAADTQTGLTWEPKEVKRFILASPVTSQRFRLYITASPTGWADIVEFSLYRDEDYGIVYSSNTGTTIHRILTSPDTGDTGGDVDDFGLGVIMHAAQGGIEYTTSYADETTTSLLGLTDQPATPNTVTCLRIPYRKLASQALNNDASSLQFIFGTEQAINSRTLWGITFNATDGTIIAESDMTPIISGTTYYVVDVNAIETAGANTQIILALAKPVGGGDTKLILSTNGGTTWTIEDALLNDRFVRWISGSTQRAWMAGANGIDYTANRGGTIVTKIGDFPDTPIGAYGYND